MAQAPTIDVLLNLAAEHPNVVLEKLQAHPELASKQDAHGYSLLHAAASYGHADLLKALVRDFGVDPNIRDEDDETALFGVEEVSMAQELIALGTDMSLENDDGQTAAQMLADENEQPAVAAFLRETARATGTTNVLTANGDAAATNGEQNGVHPPPSLPQGLQLNIGTMMPSEAGEEPDPEFRRRIEELAARSDFESEEGQRELRNLVSDAISGVNSEGQAPAASRRRLE